MDYSQLPEDILEKIATEHLEPLPQHINAFSRVCKSWRSSACRRRRRRRSNHPGLLKWKAIPWQSSLQMHTGGQHHDFFTLSSMLSTISRLRRAPLPARVTLPLLPSTAKISDGALGQRHRYLRLLPEFSAAVESVFYYQRTGITLGSKDGWLLRTLPLGARDHQVEVYLIEPISGAVVPLPPLPHRYSSSTVEVQKVIISSPPDDDDHRDCHIFILGRSEPRLAWCTVGPGGGGWNFDPHYSSSDSAYLEDAAYCKGKLYMLERSHDPLRHYLRVTVMTVGPASSTAIIGTVQFSDSMVAPPSHDVCKRSEFHMCELNDQLHVIVQRYRQDRNRDELAFQMYKLVQVVPLRGGDDADDKYYWEEVRSLDGHAVFIGPHQSFSITAPAPPAGRVTYNAGSIYFALNYILWRPMSLKKGYVNWNGVFHLPDQRLERFRIPDRNNDSCWISRPFWFFPMSG